MGRDDFERAQARGQRNCAAGHRSDAYRAVATSLRRAFYPVSGDDAFDDLLRRIDGPGR